MCDWNAGLERHEAKYREDDESTEETRSTVDEGDDNGVSVSIDACLPSISQD